jgi:hypothetical protein
VKSCKVKNWSQAFAFKCILYRYSLVELSENWGSRSNDKFPTAHIQTPVFSSFRGGGCTNKLNPVDSHVS